LTFLNGGPIVAEPTNLPIGLIISTLA